MSFKFKISPKDRASARFIGRVQRQLAESVLTAGKESGITRSDIAKTLGVNKSVVTRAISGKGNITLRTLAEIYWALGKEPSIKLETVGAAQSNHSNDAPAVFFQMAGSTSTSDNKLNQNPTRADGTHGVGSWH